MGIAQHRLLPHPQRGVLGPQPSGFLKRRLHGLHSHQILVLIQQGKVHPQK